MLGKGSLQGEVESKREDRGEHGGMTVGGVDGGRRGDAVEMKVVAPFFTADKHICLDINLDPRGSLPLLDHHPSSFHTDSGSTPSPPHTLPHTHPPHTHAHMFTLTPTYTCNATRTNRQIHTSTDKSHKHTYTHSQFIIAIVRNHGILNT